MKAKLLLVALLILTSFCYSQHNVVSGGLDATSPSGSVSYTIGQIDYLNEDNGSHSINAGVQQPWEFFILGVEEQNNVTIEVYPNPTMESVILKVDPTICTEYHLYDANGKLIEKTKVLTHETKIELINCSSGIYFLELHNDGKELNKIKIIKN